MHACTHTANSYYLFHLLLSHPYYTIPFPHSSFPFPNIPITQVVQTSKNGMHLEQLMQVGLLPHLPQTQIHPTKHPHHLLHPRALTSYVVLGIQRVDEVKNGPGALLVAALLLVFPLAERAQVVFVLVVEPVIQCHLKEQLPCRLARQVLDYGSYHKKQGICFQPPKQMVMQVERLTQLLQDKEKRFDLRIRCKCLKDVCHICSILIIAVEDCHIDDQTPQPLTEAHLDAIHLPTHEEQLRYAQFMLPPVEGLEDALEDGLEGPVLTIGRDEVYVDVGESGPETSGKGPDYLEDQTVLVGQFLESGKEGSQGDPDYTLALLTGEGEFEDFLREQVEVDLCRCLLFLRSGVLAETGSTAFFLIRTMSASL
jgi:hypothetical protein